MPVPTYTVPTNNSDTATEEPKITTALAEIKSILNGDLDDSNVAADAAIAGTKIGATFAAHVPTWTNLTVGNGTVAARYARVGDIVVYAGKLTFGSTTSVSGTIGVDLPVNADTTIPFFGTGRALNDSNNFNHLLFIEVNTADQINIKYVQQPDAGADFDIRVDNADADEPFTWTTSDTLGWQITYEAA